MKENNYCEILNRKCSLLYVCNINIYKLLEKLNISVLESYLIELILGMREIIKLEEELDIHTDEYIGNILEKYNLSKSIVFGRVFIGEDKFIIFARDKEKLNKFLYYDFSDNSVLRANETGKRLGYPNCCRQKYINYFSINPDNSAIDDIIDNNNDMLIQENQSLENKTLQCPLIYKRYSFLSHHFCKPDCQKSIEMAELKVKYILKNIQFFKNKI